MNHLEIKKKIDALPICADGKAGVTNLLKEFGYIPPVQVRQPKKGEVWIDARAKEFLLITSDEPTYSCFSQTSVPHIDWDTKISPLWITNGDVVFYAINPKAAMEKYALESKRNH